LYRNVFKKQFVLQFIQPVAVV